MPKPRTRDEDREYQRARRARMREEQSAQATASVSALHVAPDFEPGECERAVQAELDALGEVASSVMPGQANNAISMARILDNPAAILQHTSASGQLRAALLAMHEAAQRVRVPVGKVSQLRRRHLG